MRIDPDGEHAFGVESEVEALDALQVANAETGDNQQNE